jgi:hypothetical protein
MPFVKTVKNKAYYKRFQVNISVYLCGGIKTWLLLDEHGMAGRDDGGVGQVSRPSFLLIS